jgi:hypothetical protein
MNSLEPTSPTPNNHPTTLLISGNVSNQDLLVIKKDFATVGISVDRPISKADLLQEVLHFAFSDFNGVSFLRDGLLGAAQLAVLNKVRQYFKAQKKADSEVSFDKVISHGAKLFTLYITCHYNHIATIEDQLAFLITDQLLDRLPSGSRLYATGQDDFTVKVIVLERTTGKQYPLN